MRPRYPKNDANHTEIVNQLERFGFTVIDVSSLPVPALDLFVCGWHASHCDYRWLQVEIKTDEGELNKAESEYIESHQDAPIIVARCVEDILNWYRRAI